MASEEQVKRYLSYWFQLGKKVVIDDGREAVRPEPVIQGNRYSQAFENIWQQILSFDRGDCHLQGTSQTIAELLSSEWDVSPCARCEMPVPVRDLGMPPDLCPCHDLSTWPNTELPTPRDPVNSQDRLGRIRDRLQQ
jgi:hypothetical protein